ncbi:alpha/beta fold hydrolase [Sneathiella limimaris]|uniref:alpha/beta fold hydrolase n=1 Tax=Sneathiella limimaris TaxID=1964213 RepID=UPI00146D575E|nr:alpha/beta hydrolase [Sneathiella limimaris]
MSPTHHFVPVKDLKFSYFEWGDPNGQVILLAHATGMHARVWDETIKHIPKSFRIIAIESRGHGRTEFNGNIQHWSEFGDDLKEFILKLDLNNIIGVGHSVGGHMMMQAALGLQERFERLVLLDPVIFKPSRYELKSDFELGRPEDNPMSRRRNQFDSWQDMVARYKDRSPYSYWEAQVMEDYCHYGLKPAPDGDGYQLCCNPVTEASVYMAHHTYNLTDQLPTLQVPLTVVRAKSYDYERTQKVDFLCSSAWPELASKVQNGRDAYHPELTHFIPMQNSQLSADYILGKA